MCNILLYITVYFVNFILFLVILCPSLVYALANVKSLKFFFFFSFITVWSQSCILIIDFNKNGIFLLSDRCFPYV